MPVISPRRSTSTTSGSLYIPQTTSGTYSSSLANNKTTGSILTSSSTSGYSSTYRSNGLSKTPSASTYSPSSYYAGSYLSRTSAYPSVGRTSSYSSTSASALTGGSSALSSYRPSSYLSGGNNDTATASSRFGRRDLFEHRAFGTENTDCNNDNNSNTKSPRSSSKSRNSRASSSYSSPSLARLVATSALDIYEKYSPAHYIPKCELSRSSSLSEAAASAAGAGASATAASALGGDSNKRSPASNSLSKYGSYSRQYSRQTNGTISEGVEGPSASNSIIDSYLAVPSSSSSHAISSSNNNLNSSHGSSPAKLMLHVSSYDLQDDSNSLRDLKISCISPTTTTTTTTSTTSTSTTSSSSSQDTKDTAQLATKQKRSVEATTITTTTTTTTNAAAAATTTSVTTTTSTTLTNNTTSNNQQQSAKAGNQQFFLISAFKDQNFLKNECDLARSQVYRSKQRFENNATTTNDDSLNNNADNRNNSGSSSNNNNNNNNNICSSNNNANNNENGTTLAGSNSSIVSTINDNRKLPSVVGKQAIKPLIHRTPNNKFLTKIPANNNMHCLHSNSELLDDIKYIDSDDTERQQQQQQQHQPQQPLLPQQRQHKPKLRPKSSIISTSNQSLFEKVNQYKYQNGSTLSSSPPVSSSAPTSTANTATSSPSSTLPLMGGRKRDIIHDTFSIKASIEKFNTLSEAKRQPTRSSTTNLQFPTDFERKLPLRERERSASPAATNTASRAAATAGIASNLVASNSTSSGSIATNNLLLRNRSTESSPSHSPKNLRKTSVTPTAGLLNGSTSNLLKTAVAYDKVTVSMLTCPAPTPATVTSKTISNDKKPPASVSSLNKLTDIDESVRNSSSLRSGLPPISPTPARHWDRDTGRSILSSRNLSDDYTSSSKLSSSSLEDKPEQEGLCGLRNIGNTCFMNSVIQCLSHTSELTKFLKTQNGVKSSSSKDQQILSEFAKLIREMWTPNVNTVTPSDLKRAFSSKHRMYSDYNQQDAQEFLRFFLDSLHSALNSGVKGDILKIDETLSDNKKADITWEWYTKAENSVIRDLFVGQLKSTLRCTVCGNTSVTFDPFWDLSVPLPSSSRCKLEACLDLFIREEVLDGDEMPTCSKCQTRRKSTKSFSIQRFPKYLVIHLKRFSETRWSKLSNIVEFPTGERELNMSPYGSNSCPHAYYTLYAISNHMGSTAGGHYVALCKHPVTKKWHEFNDNIVSGDLSDSHLVSSSAYILFYERAHRHGEEQTQAISFLSQRKIHYRKLKGINSHNDHSPFTQHEECRHVGKSASYKTTNYHHHDRHNNKSIFLLNTFLGMLFYAIVFTSCYYLFFKPVT